MKEIILRAVKEISEEYGVPEEEVWEAAMKLKEQKIKV